MNAITIELLLNTYHNTSPKNRYASQSISDAFFTLLNMKCIVEYTPNIYCCTEKGKVWVERILEVPPPELIYGYK